MPPWELYETRSDAVAALTDRASGVGKLESITDCPLVTWQDVGPVTCVECGGDNWKINAVEAQQQLQSIGQRFGRTRIVLDAMDDAGWPIGCALLACYWALYRGVAQSNGRFAICGLGEQLYSFFTFEWRCEPIALAVGDRPGWYRCPRHNMLFEDRCPKCAESLRHPTNVES